MSEHQTPGNSDDLLDELLSDSAEDFSEASNSGRRFRFIPFVIIPIIIIAVFTILKKPDEQSKSSTVQYYEKYAAYINPPTENPYESDYPQIYLPGNCTQNGYISPSLPFAFAANENWKMYTQEELQSSTIDKESIFTSTLSDVAATYGMSFDADSIYLSTEMGAYYYTESGEQPGVAEMTVYGLPNEQTANLFYESMVSLCKSYNATETSCCVSQRTQTVYSYDMDGVRINMIVFTHGKHVCIIICAHQPDSETVFTSFLDQSNVYYNNYASTLP